MTDEPALPLSTRVNRLFTTFHARAEAEQTVDDVARVISEKLDQFVAPSDLAALRSGDRDQAPVNHQLLTAVAEHFKIPPVYLLGTGAAVLDIDEQLVLLATARDAGVRNLALRGRVDIADLADQLTQLAAQHPVTDSAEEPPR